MVFLNRAIDSTLKKRFQWNKYYSFQARMRGYTPDHLKKNPDLSIQRPFLAHSSLAIKKMQNNSEYYYSYGVIVGSTGKIVNAGKVQNWIHENISGDRRVIGWDTQIRTKFTFHLTAEWNKRIKSFVKQRIFIGSKQSFGNLFTFIEPGIYYRFESKGNGYYLSNQYSNTIKNNFSVNAYIAFRYEFFNASIEGEYFDQENKIADEDIIRALLTAGIELRYNWKIFSAFYANRFNTKRIRNNSNHFFGTLGLAFRFN